MTEVKQLDEGGTYYQITTKKGKKQLAKSEKITAIEIKVIY